MKSKMKQPSPNLSLEGEVFGKKTPLVLPSRGGFRRGELVTK